MMLSLDAITRALSCERASILLFDNEDVMRFVAWRSLSEGYRRAVEGHSPWTKGEKNPRPVYFENIAGSNLPDPLKETVAVEGVGAVAFIPIVADGALSGKFMAYYNSPHQFTNTRNRRCHHTCAPGGVGDFPLRGGAGSERG